jgi:hypothetical protein
MVCDGNVSQVVMLSWEFLAMLSMFFFMSPWYSRRASPASTAKDLTLGNLEMPAKKRLEVYRKYTRCRPPQERMNKFYTWSLQALDEVLALKETTPAAVQSGRRSSGSAKPPVDEDIPNYD